MISITSVDKTSKLQVHIKCSLIKDTLQLCIFKILGTDFKESSVFIKKGKNKSDV